MITRKTFEDAVIGLCMLKNVDPKYTDYAHILIDFSQTTELSISALRACAVGAQLN